MSDNAASKHAFGLVVTSNAPSGSPDAIAPRCNCAHYGSAHNCAFHTQEDFDAADAARATVSVTEIATQRRLGWPDFHPEDYCHRCGMKNLSWATDAATWNPVMRPDGEVAATWNEIICPQCFAELFEQRFGPTTFLLSADPRTIGGRALLSEEI